MNKKILAGAGAAIAVVAVALAKDPVIMTVNGVDVPLSEFQYLYRKNAQQQIEQQPLEEYVDMFAVYKMKVADALAEGIDTTKKFRDEYHQYRRDLAAPYLADSVLMDKYAREAYSYMGEEAEVKHIMLGKARTVGENNRSRQLLDSLRNCILNGEDFEALALEYSQDPSARTNRGNMGFLPFNKIPYYSFMKAVYTLPEGEVSEVISTPAGFHLVMGGKHRPAQGQYQAEHIMKMASARMSNPAEMAKAKHKIDSIYEIVKANPERFEDIARAESDDKNSGRNGGMLPWFGSGDMVPEFWDATVALQDGEISEPVLSPYGWHIIRRLAHKDTPTYEELRPMLIGQISNPQDERALKIMEEQNARFAKKFGGKTNKAIYDQMVADVKVNGLDDAFYEKFGGEALAETPVFTVGKTVVPLGSFIRVMRNYKQPDPELALDALNRGYNRFYNEKLLDAAEDDLIKTNADYRNLLNEFRDGSLLYEVSLQKVWDKASKDTEGLQKYFEQHKGDYKWSKPHVKGYLVQAANDSVAELLKARMGELCTADTMLRTVRKEFRGQAQIDRVLMEEGMNPMVDNLIYGGPKVTPSNANYTVYFMFDPVIMNDPQEVEDVKGRVTSDYQNQLETEWVEELRSKYPVTVYDKVLKKVK